MVAIALVWSSVPAAAQEEEEDGMSFGVDEVEDTASASGEVVKIIAEGKKLYEAQKYPEASLLFYKVLKDESPGAQAARPEAEYELGKTLLRMELYQGALTYFGQVVVAGESHPYYLPTLRGLVLLTDTIPSDTTLLSRLAPYASRFPNDVPKKYRDSFAYLVGRHLYAQGSYDEALKLLKFVQKGSPYYLQARYIEGVTFVGNYNAKGAVKSFKEVLRPLTGKIQGGEVLTVEERKILELSWLGMARVFYSTGEYNKSLKYYRSIPRMSPLWPVALFESSWSYFQLDLANKALGNLHTLNSPFFSKSYFPEAPILSGVIFFYNCKYPRVRYELEEFEYSYLPVKDELEKVLKQYEDPSELYAWFAGLAKEEGDENEQFSRILGASLNDKELQRKLKLIDAIQRESEKMKSLPATWVNSPLGTQLGQDAALAREYAVTEAGESIGARLKRVRDELVNFNVNRERILFEVERAQRGEIEAEMRAEMEMAANQTDAKKIEVTDEELYWTFDGEYWKDELGYYFFNINSECRR